MRELVAYGPRMVAAGRITVFIAVFLGPDAPRVQWVHDALVEWKVES